MNQAISFFVKFASLLWYPTNNRRKATNYGDVNGVRNSLALNGWNPDNTVPGVKDRSSVGSLTESQIANEMEKRTAEWKRLKDLVASAANEENVANLKVFEDLYVEFSADPNVPSKLIVPEISMNAGFRRASAYVAAMAQRLRDNIKKGINKDEAIPCMIPVRIAYYHTEAERLIDQQKENELQNVGTLKMDDLDKLAITKELFDEGCTQSQIRTLYPSSTGQKLYGICLADSNWKSVKLLSRMQQAVGTLGFVPWGPIRHTEITKLNNQFEAARKRKEGLPLTKDEKAIAPFKGDELGLEEFTEYVNSRTAGDGGNATKIMSKETMLSSSKNHPLKFVRNVFDSVLGNTEQNLKPFKENAETINTVTDAIARGKGAELETVAKAYATDEKGEYVSADNAKLMSDIGQLLAEGKYAELRLAVDNVKNPPAKVEEPAKKKKAS